MIYKKWGSLEVRYTYNLQSADFFPTNQWCAGRHIISGSVLAKLILINLFFQSTIFRQSKGIGYKAVMLQNSWDFAKQLEESNPKAIDFFSTAIKSQLNLECRCEQSIQTVSYILFFSTHLCYIWFSKLDQIFRTYSKNLIWWIRANNWE